MATTFLENTLGSAISPWENDSATDGSFNAFPGQHTYTFLHHLSTAYNALILMIALPDFRELLQFSPNTFTKPFRSFSTKFFHFLWGSVEPPEDFICAPLFAFQFNNKVGCICFLNSTTSKF